MIVTLLIVLTVGSWCLAEIFDSWPANFVREYLRSKEKSSETTESATEGTTEG